MTFGQLLSLASCSRAEQRSQTGISSGTLACQCNGLWGKSGGSSKSGSRNAAEESGAYLSRYIIENRPAYYRLLLDVTLSNAWEPWILYMLAAVLDTARWTQARIAAIKELMQVTADKVRLKAPKIYSQELVDVLFNQPYCRIENLVEAGIAKRETASRYLKALAAAKLLREEKIGREKLFVNASFLDLLVDEEASG